MDDPAWSIAAQKRRVAVRKIVQGWWHARQRLRMAFRGTVASAQTWGGSIVFGAAVTALLEWVGIEIVVTKGKVGEATLLLVFSLLAWVIIYFWRLFVVVPRQLRSQGEWLGAEFIFKEPRLALLTQWRTEDNGRPKPFNVDCAPPYSSIRYRVEVDLAHRVVATVVFGPKPLFNLAEMSPGGRHGWVVLMGSRAWLESYSPPMTDKAIIRVFVLGYTKQDPHPHPLPQSIEGAIERSGDNHGK